VTKTLLTTGVNVGAREVGRQVGGLGELAIRVGSWIGTSAYQVGTTSADARTWMTLPKEVQIASFEEPADLTVHLDVGNHGRTITLDDGATGHVIFIRKPTASAVPSIRSVSLFPGFDGEFDLARETAPGTDGYVGGARLE